MHRAPFVSSIMMVDMFMKLMSFITEMFNGYDWYGRQLEVREVRPILTSSESATV